MHAPVVVFVADARVQQRIRLAFLVMRYVEIELVARGQIETCEKAPLPVPGDAARERVARRMRLVAPLQPRELLDVTDVTRG